MSVVVTGSSGSLATALIDSSGVQYSGSNPIPVSITLSSVQLQDGQGSLITSHVSGDFKGLDVNILSSSGSLAAALVDSSGVAYSGSNPLPTTATLSTPQGQGDAATAMRVVVAGNSDSSVIVNNPQGQGDLATALRVVVAGNSDSSVVVNNPQGPGDAATALRVLLAGNSDSSVAINSQTAFPVNQGDVATALRVVLAGNADASVVVNSGTITTVSTVTSLTQFNGNAISTNQGDTSPGTLRVIHAGDAAASVFITGQNDSMMTWLSRTTLPTAKADGADVRPMSDKLGRGVTRPMQVRDLIMTAYVTLSTGTETTLLAASAGNFLDLIYIMGANTSGVAQQVDIRATTAGNIVATLYIPANSTAGVSLPVAWPQDNQGNNWTVDMGDVTNSNILISALFSKEV
jgi:hypothetical protein